MKRIIFMLFMLTTISIIFASCDKKDTSTAKSQTTSTKEASASVDNKDSPVKSFSKEELAKYDGKDSHPAYIAVDGMVYDVTNSKEWKEGTYKKYSPGKDYTDDLMQDQVLENLPVVGAYAPTFSGLDD